MTQELAKQWVAQLQAQIDNNERPVSMEWSSWLFKRRKRTQEEHIADVKWLIGFLKRKFNIE
jgi:hypothetical protein